MPTPLAAVAKKEPGNPAGKFMTKTIKANDDIEFIRAFAPRRNRSQRRHCRQLHWTAVRADLDAIRAEVVGRKTLGSF